MNTSEMRIQECLERMENIEVDDMELFDCKKYTWTKFKEVMDPTGNNDRNKELKLALRDTWHEIENSCGRLNVYHYKMVSKKAKKKYSEDPNNLWINSRKEMENNNKVYEEFYADDVYYVENKNKRSIVLVIIPNNYKQMMRFCIFM